MKPPRLILAAFLVLLVCSTATAQTYKAVMMDANSVQIPAFGNGLLSNTAVKIGATNSGFYNSVGGLGMARSGFLIWIATTSAVTFHAPIAFTGTNAALAPTTRTNLGLGLAALTNTSNVTAMRAFGGSTNTNEPFSGTIALTNTNVLTFSNGILLKTQ